MRSEEKKSGSRRALVEEVLSGAALLGGLRKAETQQGQARQSTGTCKGLRTR